MGFNLEDYEPVADRIDRFYTDHPEGSITTEIVEKPEGPGRWVVKASVFTEGVLRATGYAQETDGQGNVNRTSALENCETSAIGRALANLNYAAKGQRPSREEMAMASAPPPTQTQDRGTGGTMPGGEAAAPATPGAEDQHAKIRALLAEVAPDKPRSQAEVLKVVLSEVGIAVPNAQAETLRNALASLDESDEQAVIDSLTELAAKAAA